MPSNVLLLQGPMGPFFLRLAEDLERQDQRVYKINFNGGDALFYRRHNTISYTGSLQQWPDFLAHQLRALDIDRIYLFGDCRTYHALAREVAKRLNVQIFVFEEGYVRPDYITLEEGGVNGYSRLAQNPPAFRTAPEFKYEIPARVGHTFIWMALQAIIYYIACHLSRRYPSYVHHRPLNVFAEGKKWVTAGVYKLWYSVAERRSMRLLSTGLAHRYFLVPLQVHCDMQIMEHSHYDNIEQFIAEVIDSFGKHAAVENYLVFKHHPLDRGYRNHTKFIQGEAKARGIVQRVFYIHDLPLPALLKRARGTVVINSTTVLSSLHHGVPVKVMGRSIYNVPGLICQLSLAEFWTSPEPPQRELYLEFRNYLLAHNQINGNFYKRLPNTGNALGVIWPGEEGHKIHDRQTQGMVESPHSLLAAPGEQVSKTT
jgi:capsular polysaccharide export protein